MGKNYQQKQKNRIETFGFDWFAKAKKDEYGGKTYPLLFSAKEDVDIYVDYWKNCDGPNISMSIIEGPGFYIAMGNTGTANIIGYYLAPGYDRGKVFSAYNKYMHICCGQPLKNCGDWL